MYLLFLFLIVTFGPVIGLFLTGLLFDRLMLRKAMRNPKIQKLMTGIETIAEHADKFDKLLSYAEKIAENQKNKSRAP